MGHIETKSVSIDVKAQAEGVIEAYAATFNGVDSYGDTIRPGAFLKTIAERGPGGARKSACFRITTSASCPSARPRA